MAKKAVVKGQKSTQAKKAVRHVSQQSKGTTQQGAGKTKAKNKRAAKRKAVCVCMCVWVGVCGCLCVCVCVSEELCWGPMLRAVLCLSSYRKEPSR